jgi:arylsulfatase A-like enzyme
VRSRLLAVLITATLLVSVSPRASATTAAASPYLAVIVLDGFKPDYLTLAPMRHLHWLMKQGRYYDSAWVGQIESETPSSHASIATGVFPRKHSVIGFGWRDETSGAFTFMPTNRALIEQGQLARTVEQAGVPTISDLVHARAKKDVVVSLSGEKLWASAPMGVGADYLLYGKEVPVKKGQGSFRAIPVGSAPPKSTGYQTVSAPDGSFNNQDMFAARVAVKLVGSLRPRALLLNLPATDIAGHYYGGMSNPNGMREIVKSADHAIGLVLDEYRKLGIFNNTIFVVLADHGMVDGHHRVLIHPIYNAVRVDGVNQQEQELQPSLGQIWLHDPEHAQALAAELVARHFQYVEGALYKVPDGTGWRYQPTPATAANLPKPVVRAYVDLANTEASVAGPEVVLPYAEDTTGLDTGAKFHGMHGGFSWESQHIPLVLFGPGVRRGTSHFPAQMVDVAPTLERLAGLPIPKGVDGVVLSDGVTGATPAEASAQNAVTIGRSADQAAIRQHSALQLKTQG